jgi:hypothetical protein
MNVEQFVEKELADEYHFDVLNTDIILKVDNYSYV